MTENKRPVAQIRLSRVKAAIWENASDDRTFYNVTFSRLYRADGNDGQLAWKESTCFSHYDLLFLAKVAELAHSEILDRLTAPVETDSE